MFCEGTCNAWVHRIFVGLSKRSYVSLTEDDMPTPLHVAAIISN